VRWTATVLCFLHVLWPGPFAWIPTECDGSLSSCAPNCAPSLSGALRPGASKELHLAIKKMNVSRVLIAHLSGVARTGYGELKAGALVVNERGDLIMLTNGNPHYLEGTYNGFVLRFHELGTFAAVNEVPSMKDGSGVTWVGKIFRVVGHIDQYLTDIGKPGRE
jgi:hypothetical protein